MRRPRNRLLVLLTAGTLALVAIACGNSSCAPDRTASGAACPTIAQTGTTTVPHVVGEPFTRAFARLLAHHPLVFVARFIPFHEAMSEQG